MNQLKISTRLSLLVGVLSLLLVAIGSLGLWGMRNTEERLKTVYEDRAVPLGQIAEIQRRQLSNQMAIAYALIEPTPDRIARSVADVESHIGAIGKVWDAYMATKLTPLEEKLAKQFTDSRARFVQQGLRPAVAMLRAGDLEGARRLEAGTIRTLYAAAAKDTEALVQLQLDVAKEEYDAAVAEYTGLRNIAIGSIAAGLLFGAAFGFWLVRSIGRQLGAEPAAAAAVAQSVARGDLTVEIALRPGDTSSLMASLTAMRDSLLQVVSGVRENADGVAAASAQIAHGNLDLSSRTEEQASALEETAASMEELSTTVRQNADNAREASQLATSASNVALKGGDVVGRVVDTMKDINASSTKISDIIGVIDGIAFQTNILALNAAVEAARAGEQGRGFAVVAGEVRVLAQRSADAAKEIKSLIHASVERVEHGTALVDEAGATMQEIVTSIRRVTDIMGEISTASNEQSAGVAQVGEAVSQLDQATQQNAALVEESAAAAESLKTQAARLVDAVAVFKLSGGSTATAALVAAPAAAPIERRGADRARNVVRPAFQRKSAGPTSAIAAQDLRPTGTGGQWQSF